MSITDGQRVRALESNAAWVSKTADSTVVGKITLNRAGSGAAVTDVQQDINNLKTDLASAENDITILQSDVATLQALDTFIYAGNWDASTNTPTLADGDGGATFGIGATFRVSVAGTQDLGSGNITFAVGDKIVYNVNAVWEKWDANDADIDLNDLADVDTTGVQGRDFLRRNSGNTAWEDFNLDSVANDNTSGTAVALASVSSSIVRLTNASLVSFNNVPAGFSGQKFILVNRTTVVVSIINNSGGTAADRIITGTAADVDLQIDAALTFEYDATTSRWQIVGGSGGEFGGAGSGSLKWVDGVPSANTIVEASIESHTFSSGDSQSIYTVVKVPVSYKTGKPISLRLLIYSPDASGTYLIQSVSTLIRTGTDAFSSTTNQRTSTNTALTASGGTQNIAQQIILDITSTIGQINGVNVNAGHYIIIKIQRGTDTAVSDVRVLSHAAEVTFK